MSSYDERLRESELKRVSRLKAIHHRSLSSEPLSVSIPRPERCNPRSRRARLAGLDPHGVASTDCARLFN